MIFVTVGAQMPFDRLVKAVDSWAARTARTDVFAQIGPKAWRPHHIKWTEWLNPFDFRDLVSRADLIVAHAGMGSILTAMEFCKPILILPRRGDLHETRNDHQLATARQFSSCTGIIVAFDEKELIRGLDGVENMVSGARITGDASPMLIQVLRRFIDIESVESVSSGRH